MPSPLIKDHQYDVINAQRVENDRVQNLRLKLKLDRDIAASEYSNAITKSNSTYSPPPQSCLMAESVCGYDGQCCYWHNCNSNANCNSDCCVAVTAGYSVCAPDQVCGN